MEAVSVLSKVKLETRKLQDLVNRAVKGSTMVDIIPLSCLMELTVKDKKLTIRTTDNINYISVSTDVEDSGQFSMVVQSKLFTQIVGKLTTATTELWCEGNKVKIKANGSYTMALSTDADGSLITFPEPKADVTGSSNQITMDEVRSILSYNKSCKADMKEVPAYYNYYMDEKGVLTTDTFKGCLNPIKVVDTPVSLSPTVVDLIPSVCDTNGVTVAQTEDSVVFTSSIGTLVGRKCLPADVEAFPADGLRQAFEQDTNKVVLNKTQLYQALDRMCLFVDALESHKVTTTFTTKDVVLYSDYTDSTEHVPYVKDAATPEYTFEEVTLLLDAGQFKAEVSACDKESINIGFNEGGIQIANNGVTMALAVVDEMDVEVA